MQITTASSPGRAYQEQFFQSLEVDRALRANPTS
jgi:hypothetical protein